MTAGISVGLMTDFESGTATKVNVDGEAVALVRIGDEFFAIGDVCSHANVSLSEGEVWCEERQLECPKHSSSFSLITGIPETLPATQPVTVYAVTVKNGEVLVAPGGATS
jgi:3-phenylpropionate/trans-cinnamate dioxygenase ferredoxin subunit